MGTHFSKEAIGFLRGLKRNNDRVWFGERKDVYERELKAPMLALIDEVNGAMAEFAPEHVRPAPKVMMRIYRDIRFSKDKRPYKLHVSGWWVRDGLEKTSGAGYYLSVSGAEVTVAAGVYMPEREQLLAIRRHLAAHHEEFRALRKNRTLVRLMPDVNEVRMKRPPKGFAADNPAVDLVSAKEWGVSATLPVERALVPGFGKDVAARFRAASEMVRFLNAPLVVERKRRVLF